MVQEVDVPAHLPPHMGSVAAWRPGVPCAMPRAFCAYDGPGMRESIKTVAAALSALRYGPQAVEKILAMVGPKSSSSITWPAGKKVKIVFDEKDSGKRATGYHKA
eukprot:symbB.v1.2.001281.t1/scaffold68.1/size354569/3